MSDRINKYSIILPVSNGGNYVQECVNSILEQTYKDFNLLVLDNNSTDGTAEWIQSLKDEKIQLIPSNKGLSIEENWARIKDISKNEFMTMIGYDDILHPGYLRAMDDLIQKHPAATLYQTHFDYIDSKGSFIRNCWPMDEKRQAHEFLTGQMKRELDSTGTGYMMRSKDFEMLGGMPVEYPNLIFSDYQLWLSLTNLGYIATSPVKQFSYRLHQSVSVTTNGMAYQQAFFRYLDFLVTLGNKNSLVKEIINKHGRSFLLYYCEAMAHRLLKTSMEKRFIKVADLVKNFRAYAAQLVPGQDFKPQKKIRIWIAIIMDKTSLGRSLFRKIKGL